MESYITKNSQGPVTTVLSSSKVSESYITKNSQGPVTISATDMLATSHTLLKIHRVL